MEYLQQIYQRFIGGCDGQNNNTPRKVIAFGNILLDRTIKLSSTELLDRYQLPLGSRGELDVETLQKLTAEAAEASEGVEFSINPGGSAANTSRILQKLGTDTDFFGAVGDDDVAEQLRQAFEKYHVNARFQTVADTPTGLCICFIYNDDATCYANIGASSKFSLEHLKSLERDNTQAFLRPIERKQIVYIEGYFIPQRENVCDYIAQNYIRERRHLALNLSADYIVKQNFVKLLDLFKVATFVFGNKSEFDALIEMLDCKNLEQMADKLLKTNSIPKIVIVTNGANALTLITNFVDEFSDAGDVTFQSFNAHKVEQIVDVTGAGDAFVAAFLHAWLEKRSLTECLRMGVDIAAEICTQMGCNLPEK